MTHEEAVNDLNAIKEFFEQESGAYPISLEYAIKVLKNELSTGRPSEVIYGNEHNCMMTIFGECSYSETGCGDCAVVEKVRKALSADRPQGEWIPCSERLPEDSGDYLVCPSDSVLEDYSDFSEVMIMPYDADCEAFGWWVDRYDPISLGFVDSDFHEFEVLAWMPIPGPWKGADNE